MLIRKALEKNRQSYVIVITMVMMMMMMMMMMKMMMMMMMMSTFAGDIRAEPLGAGVVEEALGVGKTHYQVTCKHCHRSHHCGQNQLYKTIIDHGQEFDGFEPTISIVPI